MTPTTLFLTLSAIAMIGLITGIVAEVNRKK